MRMITVAGNLSARMAKQKIGSLNGIQKHNDRKFHNHSNKDIDPEKSYLNYELTNHDKSKSYQEDVLEYIDEKKASKKAVRKDAVVLDEWVVGSGNEFMDSLSSSEQRRYFQTAVNYFSDRLGADNIRYATVHMDEYTPHMHMGIVPMTEDGRLSSKEIFSRKSLVEIQDGLSNYLRDNGFNILRGEEKSERKHLSVKEYKELQEAKNELQEELELVSDQIDDKQDELDQVQDKFDQKKLEAEKLANLDKKIADKELLGQRLDEANSIKRKQHEELSKNYTRELKAEKTSLSTVIGNAKPTKIGDNFVISGTDYHTLRQVNQSLDKRMPSTIFHDYHALQEQVKQQQDELEQVRASEREAQEEKKKALNLVGAYKTALKGARDDFNHLFESVKEVAQHAPGFMKQLGSKVFRRGFSVDRMDEMMSADKELSDGFYETRNRAFGYGRSQDRER